MSYLNSSTTTKKKFCPHDYHLKYQQGTNKPFSVCIRCGHKRLAIITEHNKIKFSLPASKQSGFKTFLERFEEMQQIPNWSTITYKGWELPGREEPIQLCESWYTKGCTNLEGHKNNSQSKGKYFISRKQRFCYRARCQRCKLKWMYRESNASTRSLEKYEKRENKKAKHIVVSPPSWILSQPLEKLRKEAIRILKEVKCDGGMIVIHPFKTDPKTGNLYDAPHFHTIGFGWVEGLAEAYKKNGWKVIPMKPRESIFATVLYLLSHAGIKRRKHTLVWFGKLSYSELERDDEPEKQICPECGCELEELTYFYAGKPPPPDVEMAMFVDPTGWKPVKTRNLNELSKIERYEYILKQKLFEANHGITITK